MQKFRMDEIEKSEKTDETTHFANELKVSINRKSYVLVSLITISL